MGRSPSRAASTASQNFFGTGLRRAQLVHQQDVPVTVTAGPPCPACRTSRRNKRRSRTANSPPTVLRPPRAADAQRAGPARLLPGTVRKPQGVCPASRQRASVDLPTPLVTGEEQVVSAWGSHGVPPPAASRRAARTQIISPAMDTAISSGVTALMGVPTGVWTKAIFSSGMPASRRRWFTKAVFFREPMTPT